MKVLKYFSFCRTALFRPLLKLPAFFNLLPCPWCGSGDGGGCNDLCPECRRKLPFIRGSRICPGCGGELDGMLARCSGCLDGAGVSWHAAAALFEYRDEGRELIRLFKFASRPQLARPLGKMGAEVVRQRGFPVEAVVPVPMSWGRFLRRSYNQSELFAGVVAEKLHLPLVKALRCPAGTVHQSSLRRSARLKNTANRFLPGRRAERERISGKTVLLVDDIITTGATLNAAVRVLRRHTGVKEVYVLTIARTPRRR